MRFHDLPWISSPYLIWLVLSYLIRYDSYLILSNLWWAVQWSSSPWTDFVTLGRQTSNFVDFEPDLFSALVFVPRNDMHTTGIYFFLLSQHGKTCACWPKNKQHEWCWATPFGRYITPDCHKCHTWFASMLWMRTQSPHHCCLFATLGIIYGT